MTGAARCLTPRLEELIRAKVDSGMYSSASELVREAHRLMARINRRPWVEADSLNESDRWLDRLDEKPAR